MPLALRSCFFLAACRKEAEASYTHYMLHATYITVRVTYNQHITVCRQRVHPASSPASLPPRALLAPMDSLNFCSDSSSRFSRVRICFWMVFSLVVLVIICMFYFFGMALSLARREKGAGSCLTPSPGNGAFRASRGFSQCFILLESCKKSVWVPFSSCQGYLDYAKRESDIHCGRCAF